MSDPAAPEPTEQAATRPSPTASRQDSTEPPTTVLFLHGLGAMPMGWQPQIDTLPSGWRALAPWLRGTRPNQPVEFDLDTAVSDLVTLLDTEDLRRVHVVGLSLGAMVALRLAAEHPDRVDRLVLSGGQLKMPRTLMGLQLALMRRTPESTFTQRGFSRERSVAIIEALRRLDLRESATRVRTPTLVLVGNGDRANLAGAKALHRAIPGSRLERLSGGHQLNADNPDGFSSTVYEFLGG